MANVSVGTVDRVLHNRGSVAPDKETRIREILTKIDYRPNLLARSLKMNRRYRVIALMPDDQLDEYWHPGVEALRALKPNMQERGLFLEIIKYNPSSPQDFVVQSNNMLNMAPDAVMLGALFYKECRTLLAALKLRGVPFNLINAQVEDTGYQTFVGQDLKQSGQTAAHLLNILTSSKDKILLAHLEEPSENAYHMQLKEQGFKSFFNDQDHVIIKNVKRTDPGYVRSQLLPMLDKVSGIFVTTSKAWALIEALPELKMPVIGYDLLQKNVKYLREGKISFLIYQNPARQAHLGLQLLADFIQKKDQTPNQKLLPIEIVSPQNVDSYLLS